MVLMDKNLIELIVAGTMGILFYAWMLWGMPKYWKVKGDNL